jgi:hypothetical protein
MTYNILFPQVWAHWLEGRRTLVQPAEVKEMMKEKDEQVDFEEGFRKNTVVGPVMGSPS